MAHIRPASPYLCIRILAITGLKFFMGTQKTIAYRLVMRNPSYDVYFSFLIFWVTLAGKWAWPPRAPLTVCGLQAQPKVGPLGAEWYFWANRYLEIMF